MKYKGLTKFMVSTAGLAIACAAPQAAHAQAAEAGASEGSEIIVTAQKREERLKDVPVSIAVLGAADLDRSTSDGVNELLRTVPGVSSTASALGGGTQLSIRGVTGGEAVFAGASPIAYYLDGLPFGLMNAAIAPDADAYDLSRVEVLRGPQGTLYGASALNGVVRVLTNDADLKRLGAKARGMVSRTEHGGTNYRGDVSVNVPVVEDKLAIRVSASYQDFDGWIDKPIKKDANDSQVQTYRIKVNAAPTERLTIGLSAWFSRGDYGATNYGFADYTIPNLVPEPIRTDYDLYGFKIGYDFDGFTVTSNTSYLKYINDSFIALAPTFPTIIQNSIIKSKTFNQELNLASTGDGPWKWTAGAMYRHSKDDLLNIIPGLFPLPLQYLSKSESYAVFGELTRQFADGKLELTGGLRYFEDKVTNNEASTFTGLPPAGVYGRDKFDKVTPRVVLNWHPNRDVTVYASYSQGFRSGTVPSPAVRTTVPDFPAIKPDTLTNYELGSKGSLLDGVLGYEAAIYYIDWKDIQQPALIPVGGVNISSIVNSEAASGFGAELALTLKPVRNLTLTGSFAWNDLTLDAPVVAGGITLFPKGNRLNQSPKYTAGASATYVAPLGGDYEAIFSGSLAYISKMESRRLSGPGVLISPGDSLLTARASASLKFPENWTATLFVDNITDENGSPLNDFAGYPYFDQRQRPRTIGAQVEFKF